MYTKDYYSSFCHQNGIEEKNQCEGLSRILPPAYSFSFNCSQQGRFVVTSGFGMNNVPHLLTALQLYNIVRLQKLGVDTQIVLGDFDVMLARGYQEGENMAHQYMTFVKNLNYDIHPESLRSQYASPTICRYMIQYSSHIYEEDFLRMNEDIDVYYNNRTSLDFPTKVSIALMVADFVSLLSEKRANHVVVLSGIDESKYPILAETVRDRLLIPGSIGGVFSKLVKGLNNHPKMSKSRKGSSILLTDDMSYIHQVLASDTILKQQLEEWVPQGEDLFDIISLLVNSWHNK